MYIETFKGRTKAELRSPDACGNPYLVYALLIYAGLSGIERKLDLPEEKSEGSLLLPASRKEAGKLARESDFVKSVVPEGIILEYTKA